MNAIIEHKMYNMVGDFFKSKPKEKMDMILEPMQVMIQLALLSFCPLGTKLSVNRNILSLHPPSFSQGVYRWFNQDSKEDLYFLFNVVRRYYKWYKKENHKIYNYILDLAKKGISNLVQTYEKGENPSITKTLRLYYSIVSREKFELLPDDKESEAIDTAFEYIKHLYTMKIMVVVYNLLKMMESEENEKIRKCYRDGLENILHPFHEKIHMWINQNLSI